MSELFGPPRQVLAKVDEVAPAALEGLAQWIEARGLRTPVSNIVGFAQFLAQAAPQIALIETTTSLTYTDLATVGPTLSGLADGNYVILFGCRSAQSVAAEGTAALMSISVNGATAVDADAIWTQSNTYQSAMNFAVKTLSGGGAGGNTITAKYRMFAAGTGSYGRRTLLAIRYANL